MPAKNYASTICQSLASYFSLLNYRCTYVQDKTDVDD